MSTKSALVCLTGWKVGLRTIDLMKALREFAHLRLPEAKRVVERVVDGEQVEIFFDDEEKAQRFVEAAVEMGAVIARGETMN